MSFLGDVATDIGGSNDPSTLDQNGLTQANRRQVMFGGLTNLGALLMAAGQPMYGPDRARYLAQIGQVPGQMQSAAYNMAQQKLMGMKQAQAGIQMQQQAKQRQILNSPEFQSQMAGLDPSTAALLKASAAGGDMGTIAKIYDSMQPKMSAYGVVYDPRKGTIFNTFTGERQNLNAQPGEPGAATGTIQPPDNSKLQPGERNDAFLNSLPAQSQQIVRMFADGSMPPPTGAAMRNPQTLQYMSWAKMYDPSFEPGNYAARNKLYTSMTSGPMFQNTISPSRKFLNHANDYLNTYDTLGLENGASSWAGNTYKLAKMQFDRDPRLAALANNAQGVKDEFSKFMAGKGQLTDLARKMEAELDGAQTPEQAYATVGKMVQLMKGQLDPVAENYRQVYRNPNYLSPDLLDDDSRASLQSIEGRIAKMPNVSMAIYGKKGAPASASQAQTPEAAEVQKDAAGAAQGATPQQPALPPGADPSKYDYRFVNGKWQRRAK